MQFEWDDAKAQSNLAKHGIPFDEAVAVFADPSRVDTDCTRDVDGETRRKTVGIVSDRLLTVVYTLRESRVRLISARPPSAKEVRFYGHR
jgi:uncharacterized protein